MKKVIAFILVLSMLIVGCASEEQQEVTTAGLDMEADPYSITYPSQVSIYHAKYWEMDQEQVWYSVCDDPYILENTYAEGERYTSAGASGVAVNFKDGGMAFYGNHDQGLPRSGFAISYYNKAENSDSEDVSENPELYKKYMNACYFTGASQKDDAAETDAQNVVFEKLKGAGLPDYTMTGVFLNENGGEEICYWKQTVDDIPFSSVEINLIADLQDTSVYNEHLSDFAVCGSLDSTISFYLEDSGIRCLNAANILVPAGAAKTAETVSAESAYESFLSIYNNPLENDAALQNMELQYLAVLDQDGGIWLCPVWVIMVRKNVEESGSGTEHTDGYEWCFYLIDALSGKPFTGADL